ncbi:hypothetical protein C7S13_0037 [Burkholderia cepacia]|nr:hypothetical protein [Burkholderia cepacia]MDW9242096.1 hypothetical protein [Burkholderia cepacia]
MSQIVIFKWRRESKGGRPCGRPCGQPVCRCSIGASMRQPDDLRDGFIRHLAPVALRHEAAAGRDPCISS